MSWDWGAWLLVDAALLVGATAAVLVLFGRDLYRGMRGEKKKGPKTCSPHSEGAKNGRKADKVG